ncbi:MAG: hypothetical protein ACO387_07445 [Flavobacteriaceae bacterium]
MQKFFALMLGAILVTSCVTTPSVVLQTEALTLALDHQGKITELTNRATGEQFLANEVASPLIQIKTQSGIQQPIALREELGLLHFEFEDELKVTLRAETKTSHLRFEVTAANRIEAIEWLAWGPIATRINLHIGETVGVVRGETYALGIQSLNPKTLGGYPWYDNDTTPQLDIFEQDDYSDLSEEGKRETLYRVEAAKPEPFGSTLQAYARNRFEKRVVTNLNHAYYHAPIFDDQGILGSAIALFGTSVEHTLETIRQIEQAEGLPHPQIDGQWAKTAKGASAAYLIYDFSEKTIDYAIALTKQAGLNYLYHSDPFKNWGHFDLKEEAFPNGWDGMKASVDKAGAAGIFVGVHTLSNFITPNDQYVSPTPDSRLGIVGSSSLSAPISVSDTEIEIENPDFFAQYANNNLKTVRIGKELIRYGSVRTEPPYKLIDCERGAWQTAASAHTKGEEVHKLADHAYKVFLTNPELSVEMAERLAERFNYANLRQISFDGLEGNRSTGMGNYGEILFTNSWFNKLNDSLKSHLIIDASRTTHFFWHTYTRMNWGEPWYAGFRESQTEYRMKNQAYFERNLMPNMLGWFSLRANTTVEDIDWMLARSAAYDAGYALVVRDEALQQNGQLDAILKRIGDWEQLRMSEAFSTEQKERMKGTETEFELVYQDETVVGLRQVHTYRFTHEPKVRQPGEPLYSRFTFENPVEETELHFILTAQNTEVSDILIELDNSKTIRLDLKLLKGESFRFTAVGFAEVVDQHLQFKQRIDLKALALNGGAHQLAIDANFSRAEENAALKVELRLADAIEDITQVDNF